MAVLISHQQPSVTCKYQNMCHSRSCVQHADRLFPTLRCLATKQSQLVTLLTRSKVCITKVKNVHSKYYKRLKNPLIVISSHNFNSNDHGTELCKDEFRVLMEQKSKRPCLKQRLCTEYFADKNYKEERTSRIKRGINASIQL